MGIGAEVFDIITSLRLQGYLGRKAAVMEIGAQQLANSFLYATEEIKRVGYLFGIDRPFDLTAPIPTNLVHGSLEHLQPTAPLARDFWIWLGLRYSSVDIDESPGSIPLDLNTDSVPPESAGTYNLVTNFGTTEHVANQLNAFKVIHDLTAIDGVMIHALPAQGMFNHGLINYNFKFFWMLARSNGYQVLRADYSQGPSYPLPKNIVDFINLTNPQQTAAMGDCQGADGMLTVIMQKLYDMEYVPPLDVPTGVKTDIEALNSRYRTVFEPDVFVSLARERRARQEALEISRQRLRQQARRGLSTAP